MKLGHCDPIFQTQKGNLVMDQHAKPQRKRTKTEEKNLKKPKLTDIFTSQMRGLRSAY